MTRARRVFLRRIKRRKIGLKCYIFLCLLKREMTRLLRYVDPAIAVHPYMKCDVVFKRAVDQFYVCLDHFYECFR